MMLDTGLQGKTAVVTGGNQGIGAAIAKALAAQGGKVFIQYLRLEPETVGASPEDMKSAAEPGMALYARNRARGPEATLEAIHAAGGQAIAWEGDLGEPAVCEEALNRAEAAFGPVEILVNNAAHWEADGFVPAEGPAPTPDRAKPCSAETIDRHFAVNYRAVCLLTAGFARRHIARGAAWGRIVNISTDAARCFPGEVSYGASKAAIEAATRAAAMELGPYGITVNVIAPGPIQTGYIPPDFEAELLERIPLGRLGEPEDIADAVVLLASEQARWITGQHLIVGGGSAV